MALTTSLNQLQASEEKYSLKLRDSTEKTNSIKENILKKKGEKNEKQRLLDKMLEDAKKEAKEGNFAWRY